VLRQVDVYATSNRGEKKFDAFENFYLVQCIEPNGDEHRDVERRAKLRTYNRLKMAYTKLEWNDPEFTEVAAFLVENGVKLPLLMKIGLYQRGEEKLFTRFIRENRLKPTRGRQATSVSLKDKSVRRHLLTAICFYNRQDLSAAVKQNQLPKAIVKAYKYFQLVHNTAENGTKLTIERFILAVTSEEYNSITIENCNKCSGKYIRSSLESRDVYGCISCEAGSKPIFTSLPKKQVA
jgi:hypothetical protein